MENEENISARKIAIRALLVALAMVLSFIESQIPIGVMVPGMKLGLTNIVVMVALYRLDEKEAIIINVIRIFLVGFTFGNLFSIAYSLAGGILSGIVMILLKKTKKVGMTTVSVAGGISHNVGQIIVAMVVMNTNAILYYLLVLWITGVFAGVAIGILSAEVIKRLPRQFK
ncbi:MAG: Gx transporter family protein [Lachnospiraceae bacterium]|jgi:heptaprenyl diphosphate synthase|nr:Gx transporter family protein [Lachnospiraceae bacterium]